MRTMTRLEKEAKDNSEMAYSSKYSLFLLKILSHRFWSHSFGFKTDQLQLEAVFQTMTISSTFVDEVSCQLSSFLSRRWQAVFVVNETSRREDLGSSLSWPRKTCAQADAGWVLCGDDATRNHAADKLRTRNWINVELASVVDRVGSTIHWLTS